MLTKHWMHCEASDKARNSTSCTQAFLCAVDSENSSASLCPSSWCAVGSTDIVSKQLEANGRLRIDRVKGGKGHGADTGTNESRSFIPF